MIDDIASLKHAMEQMDADDATVAQAARERAEQILSNAGLSFAKIAELIEERRLLLRPRIVASIKRMDQPAGLGDAAFRDTGASLRKEGQSFRQIAEALELGGPIAPKYEKAAHSGLHPEELEQERDAAEPSRTGSFVVRSIQLLVLAGLIVVSVYALREFAAGNWHFPGYRAGLGAAQRQADTTTQPANAPARSANDAASPSAGTASSSTPPATTPASPTNEQSAATPTVPANPPVAAPPPTSTPPRSEAKSTPPPTRGANERPRTTAQSRIFHDFMPDQVRRKSRLAGPCMGGVGGCYWGGGQY
jgi:hypothetical protein